ncbi:ABC transporter permease [Primorskyibacter flagellatus]|uniref:ABC transporter permease n=1 Tax=Primorskyibacter flagellatus TaxID=1387277 RepID=A0A917EK22_9RHOB|nr:ABC transporter permease [Primorskyibacter flagellatus]GGE46929.1 ABC transporter permease [Primorskyibacter flagellatus]
MLSYILRRLAATIPTLLIVSLFIFSLLYIGGGDPAAMLAGGEASAVEVEKIRETLGLNDPYLSRYMDWLTAALQGDLGQSLYSQKPVTELILQRVEPTAMLTVTTMIVVLVLSIPLGILAAWQAGRATDRAVMIFAVVGFSVPIFVVAYVGIYFFSVQWRLLPVQGYTSPFEDFPDFLGHMVLPSLALGLTLSALVARITRASMLEVLSQHYIRTARAKGLGDRPMLLRHALKNAAVPIVTVIGLAVATLIGGVVVTETVFAIPGVGRLTVDAILRRDFPVIQGVLLVFSFVYVLVNLAVDLSYSLFDPRIRYR